MTSSSSSQSVGVFFLMALSVFTEALSSDALTHECDHPSLLPLYLSAENHLFFLAMPLFCLSRLSPGDIGTWQSEPQWLVWSSSILLMAPAVTSEGRVPFLGKVLSSMALQHYLHTQWSVPQCSIRLRHSTEGNQLCPSLPVHQQRCPSLWVCWYLWWTLRVSL